jgi:hypothetical protein
MTLMAKRLDFENPPEPVRAFALELAAYLEKRRELSPGPVPFDELKRLTWRSQIKLGAVNFCAAVHWARREGHPIASSNRGYWYAVKPEELDITVGYFMSKVTREHAAISYLKKIQSRMQGDGQVLEFEFKKNQASNF